MTSIAFRLIVFDLDGTLVDSRRDLAESVNALLAERGLTALPEELVGRMVGDGVAALVSRAFAAAGVIAEPGALDRFLTIYHARLLNYTRPYDGIREVLSALAPRIPLAVLTNKSLAATLAVLGGLGLTQYFPAPRVLGGDGPLPRKPDPAGLERLASLCDVPVTATLLVGDSLLDACTARAAAARLCLARYGFGFQGLSDAQIAPDDYVIERPLDLLGIV